ncbi:MAG: hypothetical protein Q8K79_09565 [Solirubrobacteraceae bacterium]|nr:hypothetical protein [Solirubrobacteraceae bacterium]
MHKATFEAFATWRTDAAAGPPPRRTMPAGSAPGEPLRAPPRSRAAAGARERLRRVLPRGQRAAAARCA